MEELKKCELENNQIVADLKQLSETEDTRLSVITSVFIRKNNEMRLKNIQDIKKDISYGAKNFGQFPEKYSLDMENIVKSYIEETNKFMNAYNKEFINIQNILKDAEERQKYYFFKIREIIVMKNVCLLAGKNEIEFVELDKDIEKYKRKISLYEEIILECDKKFEECSIRREQEFKELFEIKQEQALMVITKNNIFIKILKKIKNVFNGYENFSKCVLQKYFSQISKLKTEMINECLKREKQNELNFSNKIKIMLANY